jgi:hypothetical protein
MTFSYPWKFCSNCLFCIMLDEFDPFCVVMTLLAQNLNISCKIIGLRILFITSL